MSKQPQVSNENVAKGCLPFSQEDIEAHQASESERNAIAALLRRALEANQRSVDYDAQLSADLMDAIARLAA